MLMSPIPVLAQLVKKNLADSATAAVQGATALADFAAQQTAGAFDPAGDVPMLDDIPTLKMQLRVRWRDHLGQHGNGRRRRGALPHEYKGAAALIDAQNRERCGPVKP